MIKEIKMPFFSISNGKLMYLNKVKVCELPKERKIKKNILKKFGAILEIDEEVNINKKRKVLVVEPHPDDFALSAMGYIEDDMDVTVLNIFSKMKLESFTWKKYINISSKEYEKLRLLESKIAVEKILKYKFISLREESINITYKNHVEIRKNIINTVFKMMEQSCFDILMIPMGLGEHKDHTIVYESIIEKCSEIDSQVKIIFYPEYPYARNKKAYNERLSKIQDKIKLREVIVNIEKKLKKIINAIVVYKSQHDDIDREQMLAIVREDVRAIATEYDKNNISLVYYELDRSK